MNGNTMSAPEVETISPPGHVQPQSEYYGDAEKSVVVDPVAGSSEKAPAVTDSRVDLEGNHLGRRLQWKGREFLAYVKTREFWIVLALGYGLLMNPPWKALCVCVCGTILILTTFFL